MGDRIERVESFIFTAPRDEPYLGGLAETEVVNSKGYFVRRANRTVYPVFDRSVLVRLSTREGLVGWGETYGIVAPGAAKAIIDDLLAEFLIGRDPMSPVAHHDFLYDLMRVRGYTGGFYLDALAAVDIAAWDLAGKAAGVPLSKLLGGHRRERIPAYVSGLPGPTLEARVELARSWQERGFEAFKVAAAVADHGNVEEIAALRGALGHCSKIAIDLHWKFDAAQAIQLARELEPHRPWFLEAPLKPEDLDGQARVAAAAAAPIALGEEWRTAFEARPRFERKAMSIVQPEMGHTGVTEFMRISTLAHAFHVSVIPHATIGIGIFLAASLHASAAVADLPYHEFQHTVLEKNLRYLSDGIACEQGYYTVPQAPGLGVEPNEETIRGMLRATD
ncbi:MAG: mandelate racemase/muconate lactonizing enzyme family protein [Gammaproteobacteria bacterium]